MKQALAARQIDAPLKHGAVGAKPAAGGVADDRFATPSLMMLTTHGGLNPRAGSDIVLKMYMPRGRLSNSAR